MTPAELRALVVEVVRSVVGDELRALARRELARLSFPLAERDTFTTEEVMAVTGLGRVSVFNLGKRGAGPLVRAPGRGRQTHWTRASVERLLASRGQRLVRSERAQ